MSPRARHLRPVPTLPDLLAEPSAEEVARHLALLGHPVHALRVLGGTGPDGRKVWPQEGYADNAQTAGALAMQATQGGADAVYVALQRVDPECLHRRVNAWGPSGGPGKVAAVSAQDIRAFEHLLIDVDAARTTGTSATDEELTTALEVAHRVVALLRARGWPEPLYVLCSGNGAHVVYKLHHLKNTPDTAALLRNTLKALDAHASTKAAHVDTTVHNPARITKLAGTWARKGSDTRERPHRVASLLETNPETTAVPVAKLRDLAASVKPGKARGEQPRRTGHDVEALVAAAEAKGLRPRAKPWQETTLVAMRCPLEDHGNASAFAVLREDGWLARCHHASCDLTTERLLDALGLDAEALPAPADEIRECVERVNATGLCELWEGGSLLYVVAAPGGPERLIKSKQAAQTYAAKLPPLEQDDGAKVPAFNVWQAHPDARRALGSVFDPSAPFGAILGEGDARRLNRWQGLAYAPERSDVGDKLVRGWETHLREILCGGRADLALHVLRTFAWKLRHPTQPAGLALVLQGPPGCGKGVGLRAFLNLFGAHGLYTQGEAGRFNAHVEGRAVIFHDEADFLADPSVIRRLKGAITEEEVTVEAKGVDAWTAQNMALHVVATNQRRVALEPQDRRFLLVQVEAVPAAGHFERLGIADVVWASVLHTERSRAFHAALLARLLRLRLPAGWRPYPAPSTEEREVAIRESLPPLEAWLAHALDTGTIPGLQRPWRGRETLGADERQTMWSAFRAWSGARERGGSGDGSFTGFAQRVVRLLGIRVQRRKLRGRTERFWALPKYEIAVTAFSREIGGARRKIRRGAGS